jgi:hypothetical protein
MEVVDIDLGSLEPIQMNLNSTPSYDFDNGLELLMNDSKLNSKSVKMTNLDELENELNDLSNSSQQASSSSSAAGTKTLNGMGSWFNFSSKPTPAATAETKTDSNLGQATKESVSGNTKTWDGFAKINEVPFMKNVPVQTNMTERDRRRKKRMMLKKLEEWEERGHIKRGSNLSLDSSYEEIEDEYETAIEEKRKKDSLKLQSWWLKTLVNSVEYANTAFDPFGMDISGFGEQVEEDMESYEEVFGELYEKYKGGKLAPEISILLKLGITAATINITNRALSGATPGFRDVIKQSPDLMKMFTNATVDAMGKSSPGFAFASNLVNGDEEINKSHGPPPAPIETKNHVPQRRPQTMEFTERPNPQRPDISQARGSMFKEQGVEINNSYRPLDQSSYRPPDQSSYRPQEQEKPMRAEMKGPSDDIEQFLSGLKPTRSVNIHDEDSMLSISSLKDLQNTKMPKHTKRKVKSEKNTISLDI